MSADTLTDAQARHLRELRVIEGRDQGVAYWRPTLNGEVRCAQAAHDSGYLVVADSVGGRPVYELTPAGREALARYDAANDDVSRGAACHTGEAGDAARRFERRCRRHAQSTGHTVHVEKTIEGYYEGSCGDVRGDE